jgi:RNA polymerase sigma-70 factor, ECF subfamily
VRNLSIETCRKRRRMPLDQAGSEAAPARPVLADSRADLAAAMSNLPETHSEILLMRFVDGLKLEEIAQALGIPLGTVKSRMHNGLEMLRQDPLARRYFKS